MANRSFTRSLYTLEEYPVVISCKFVVDSSNSNGLGISSLKGPGVASVYMHTSATPASGSPNPASGTIVVRLQDNYNRLLSEFNARVVALSGSNITISAGLTVGVAYVITAIGTSSAANFHTIGVPAGVTPAVGVAFIAAATGAGAGSGTVQAAAAAGSGVASIELVGDTTLALSPLKLLNQGYGGQVILQARDYAGAIVAPANGSEISISLYLSNGSNKVQGE